MKNMKKIIIFLLLLPLILVSCGDAKTEKETELSTETIIEEPAEEIEEFAVHSEEGIEITVSGHYFSYNGETGLTDKNTHIQVFWKNNKDEEYDLCTYANLVRETENGWEDASGEWVYNDVLYQLLPGGETMMRYDLGGIRLTDGVKYRLYLGGFDETENYVEFTPPIVYSGSGIYDRFYVSGDMDGVDYSTVSLNTKTQRYSIMLRLNMDYDPSGYYLNGKNGEIVLCYDDGELFGKMKKDGENLVWEESGETYHFFEKGTVFEPYEVIYGNLNTYVKLPDGTYRLGDMKYKYRLEITGRLNGAVKDTTYVYLSNLEDIPFDRAWKASGLSSNTDDYFKPEEAVLVELK